MTVNGSESLVNVKINEEDNKVAGRMIYLRKKLGMSLEEMAKFIGIDEMELYEYEKCLEPVPASILAIVSAFVGITIDFFFSDEEIEIVSFEGAANEDKLAELVTA